MSPPATILIVDDDAAIRSLIAAVASRLGLAPRMAGNGREALELIAAEAPAMMVLELLIPELDGLQLMRRLKTSAPQLLARTIVITGAGIRNVGEAPELKLAYKFLRKPLDIDALGAALRDCARSVPREGDSILPDGLASGKI